MVRAAHALRPARPPVFDLAWRRSWAGYQRYNRAFADAIADEAAEGATVMIQDYHLFLAPRLLRDLRPDVRIGHFTHTPWVPAGLLPHCCRTTSRTTVVDGMLGADVVGFHSQRWADLFADCCRIDLRRGADEPVRGLPARHRGDEMHQLGDRRDVDSCAAACSTTSPAIGMVIGRVDRTELSKNVWRGLLAYRELLRTPSRMAGPGRARRRTTTRRGRTCPPTGSTPRSLERSPPRSTTSSAPTSWTPLLLEIQDDYPGSLAALRRSDVVFVNSVRDGMNLVVLEALVLSERDPAVVISREMGAADVLGDDAISVNPFDVSASAEALHAALLMPATSGRARRRMREAAVALPPMRVVPGPAGRAAVTEDSVAAARRHPPGPPTTRSAAAATAAPRRMRTATLQAGVPDARSRATTSKAGRSPTSSPMNSTPAARSPTSRRSRWPLS